jgi:heptosyltransferase-2
MKHILIITPAWIGDAIMAEALYQVLKNQKDCHITVLAPQSIADIHQRMSTVDNIIVHQLPRKKLSFLARYRLAKTLRPYQFDAAFILPNSWKSALIPWLAKIPVRIGWLGEMRYGLLTQHKKLDKTSYPMMVSRYLALANWQLTKEIYQTPRLYPDQLPLERQLKKQKIIALCPGAAYGSSKRWPIKYYGEVANKLIKQNHQIYLFGGPNDADTCDKINQLTKNSCMNLAGKTSLPKMVDIMANVDHVITNDTGLMHVAAALQKPLIAIFGSSSPGFTPPLYGDAIILSKDNLACKPCFARECPLGDLKCLHDITPQTVLQNIDNFWKDIE